MNDNKVVVNDYEVMEQCDFGGKGFFFAEYKGKDQKERYCSVTIDRSLRDLGFERYMFSCVSDNYVEVLKNYHENIIVKIDEFAKQTKEAPVGIYTREQCDALDSVDNINGCIVVQSISNLYHEYQNASNQIFLATGGFGCNKDSMGSAVYAINLFNGESIRLEREDLLGILKNEYVPDWARKQQEKMQTKKSNDIKRER